VKIAHYEAFDSREEATEREKWFKTGFGRKWIKRELAAGRTRQAGTVEPASKLLERILTERCQKWEETELAKMRVKGKKPKNDKWKEKYKEPVYMHERSPFKSPNGWRLVRAEQICDFITKGTTPNSKKLFAALGEIPFIKVYNLTHVDRLDFRIKPTFISKETHQKELARSIVFPKDVLMNIVGPPLGKVAIVPDTFPEWNMNQAVAVFRLMPSYDCKLLGYFLMSKLILGWAKRRAKATAGQLNLTLEICRNIPLPVLSKDEQQVLVQEIESRLSAAEKIEQTVDANLQRAERLRQSILKQAFSGKLV